MGLLQPSNISPSTKAGYGNMAIYSSDNINIAWQINGDTAMTDFKIDFYKNDTASTYVGTTGKITITPVMPMDLNGNPIIFESESKINATWTSKNVKPINSAVTEYKYKITQYWDENGTEKSIEQIDYNVVYCAGTAKGAVTLADITPSEFPIKTLQATLTPGTDYSSYNRVKWTNLGRGTKEVDTINFKDIVVFYNVANKDYLARLVNQYGTESYSNTLTLQNLNFQQLLSKPKVEYENIGSGAIKVSTTYPNITGTTIVKGIEITKVSLEGTSTEIKYFVDDTSILADKWLWRIYSLPSNNKYRFRQFMTQYENGVYTTLSSPYSDYFCYKLKGYKLISAKREKIFIGEEYERERYYEEKSWFFQNNITTGAISNNNAPNLQENFTGYRFKQPNSRKGRSGTLSALLTNVYEDINKQPQLYNNTAEAMKSLFEASNSTNDFFLLDPKGNFYKIAISQPITQQINDKSAKMQVNITLGWEEIADASEIIVC